MSLLTAIAGLDPLIAAGRAKDYATVLQQSSALVSKYIGGTIAADYKVIVTLILATGVVKDAIANPAQVPALLPIAAATGSAAAFAPAATVQSPTMRPPGGSV